MSAHVMQCPVCGGRLYSAYQKRGKEDPKYVLYCSHLGPCTFMRVGRGDTIDEALTDLLNQSKPSQKQMSL